MTHPAKPILLQTFETDPNDPVMRQLHVRLTVAALLRACDADGRCSLAQLSIEAASLTTDELAAAVVSLAVRGLLEHEDGAIGRLRVPRFARLQTAEPPHERRTPNGST